MTLSLGVSAQYHPNAGVSIEGTPRSLIALARVLEQPAAGPVVILKARGDSDAGRALTELRLTASSGPVEIEVRGRRLAIRGGAEQLRVLAQNVAWFASHGDPDDPGDHSHVEYYEVPADSPPHYLAPSAEPLILAFQRDR